MFSVLWSKKKKKKRKVKKLCVQMHNFAVVVVIEYNDLGMVLLTFIQKKSVKPKSKMLKKPICNWCLQFTMGIIVQ